MTIFDDREHAHEAKFAFDAELLFRAQARRNRMLGEWAAGLLGKTGDEASIYVQRILSSDFEEPGDEDVFRKLSADLEGRTDASAIRAKMDEMMNEAKRQVIDGGK